MTHIENIPHVLEHGLTHRTSPNHNPAFVPIGDGSLINKRNASVMPNSKRLGDYMPFYFGPRMPMLYTIQRGYSGVQSVPPEKIVYCISSVFNVTNCKSVDFVFTNGHAYSGLSEFFSPADVPNIEQIIDREAINIKYWDDANDLDLRRRKEAEFLVFGDLPTSAIRGYAVYSETAKATLVGWGIPENKVVVKLDYYF